MHTRLPLQVPGVVGLRLRDAPTGCALQLASLTVDGARPITLHTGAAAIALLGQTAVHARVAEQHAFVHVEPGTHWVSASFDRECANETGVAEAQEVCSR